MTEVSTEPAAVEAAPTTPPPPPTPPAAPAPTAPAVDHTPGGWPVVPLAVSGANTTVSMVAAAALAGGPIAAAVAATGATVLAVAAANRTRKPSPRREARRAAARTAGRAATAGSAKSGTRTAGTRSARAGGPGTPAARRAATASRHAAGAGAKSGRVAQSRTGSRSGPLAKAAGRAGQVRALRAAQRAAGGSRAEQRAQTTAARRAVADARRNARAAARTHHAPGSRGSARRAAGWTGGKASSGTRALVGKTRTARDRSTAAQVDAKRAQVRRAPARRSARRALVKSAARFQARRLLAALLALPLGLLGLITTPLGRKLGWEWLMYPGRRLYRRLMQTARDQRAERDEAIRAQRAQDEAAAEETADEIGDRVERPAHLIPTPVTTGQEAIRVSGFKFDEAAAEMENAARTYEPDGNMEVLAMIDNLPMALLSIANTFRILAERSDEEFAFEKDVAAGFDDIHATLLNAVDAAETLVPLFRSVHEADIARHEDPRNGTQAEKGWNV